MTHFLSCHSSSSSSSSSSSVAFLIRHPGAVAPFRPARGVVAMDDYVTIPKSTMSKSIFSSSSSMSSLPWATATTTTISFGEDNDASEAMLVISTLLDNNMDTTAVSSATATTSSFEAVLPDPAIILGMGFVVLLCIAASYVWANEVVPVSRTKLAISKSRGEVREYLDGLRKSNETNVSKEDAVKQSIDSSASNDESNHITRNKDNRIDPPSNVTNMQDGRDFERWLFSDWLNKPTSSRGGRQKEPALPILREAKWNSGDNPVLVTAAIMMLGVVLASITERIAN